MNLIGAILFSRNSRFSDKKRPVGMSADWLRGWKPGSQRRSFVGRSNRK